MIFPDCIEVSLIFPDFPDLMSTLCGEGAYLTKKF